MEHRFERKTGSQLWYSYLGIWQAFLQKKKKNGCREPVTSRKTTNKLNKFQVLQAKIKILENFICHHKLGLVPMLKDFSGEIGGILMNMIFGYYIIK